MPTDVNAVQKGDASQPEAEEPGGRCLRTQGELGGSKETKKLTQIGEEGGFKPTQTRSCARNDGGSGTGIPL